MSYAHRVFDQIPHPNVAIWNAMFRGYANNECHRETIVLFSRMKSLDISPNCFTFPVVIKSCGKIDKLIEGEEVHCVLIKDGFRANPFVGTTLIEMYSGQGVIAASYKVFGEMLERNVVAWTSMINGYILCHDMASAHRLFDLSPERDIVLWNTVISGYIELGNMEAAQKLFNEMPKRDVMAWNTMLNGYSSNGNVEACERLFKEMPERNVFSWNGLIGGYARNGHFFEVLGSFKQMLTEGDVLPNDATLVTVLSACARLGALDLGKWVHVYAESIGYKRNVYVGNALIDMYAKCGLIDTAVGVFKSMDTKDLITWNSVICSLAMHGRGADALNLFFQMKNSGEKPDGITFIGILCACTHLGLVDDGFSYFQSMVDDYLIVPQIEHYGCMVDLLARAGLLDQAVNFVRNMPVKADAVIWAALLGACRIYKNIELAEHALERLIELEPKNPANYVMLSNIYAALGRWKDVAKLKVAMRDTGFKKLPGCSLIEVNDDVVEFYSLDERHPKRQEIYGALTGLAELLQSSGYVPNLLEVELGA
ncbi:pentatricopeptide repeat-containing protein At1g08070, chloroplastic [Ziziphus jujuba]|uniref:Pentatricopeptide repeat-containing protein At1g08070, chloroplastic n=1 Tax=Ziziphus jujuba TaxID=326968 RepID=A0A6P3ZTV2_ZIZJJ|nr:pentatricopeptide repeat-containing protein At1g08070, chloroplastic [Ziziphus jujuba]